MVRRGMERGEIVNGDLMIVSSSLFGGPIRMVTSELDGILDRPVSTYLDEAWRLSWRAVAHVESE